MIKAVGAALLLVAAALSPNAAFAARPASKPVARDWSRTVVMTPQGGMRMGNPAARVKLIEYGSLACPHCRHFEQTGYKPLVDRYVRKGKVSYEFRNLLISGPDIAISLLVRCSGPSKFFPMASYAYEVQPQWQEKIAAMTTADGDALNAMTDRQRVVRFAEIGGMAAIARRFGMTPAQTRRCLTDAKALEQLLKMTQAANDAGINRTPTFLINGKVVDGATWEALEPTIREAGGG